MDKIEDLITLRNMYGKKNIMKTLYVKKVFRN